MSEWIFIAWLVQAVNACLAGRVSVEQLDSQEHPARLGFAPSWSASLGQSLSLKEWVEYLQKKKVSRLVLGYRRNFFGEQWHVFTVSPNKTLVWRPNVMQRREDMVRRKVGPIEVKVFKMDFEASGASRKEVLKIESLSFKPLYDQVLKVLEEGRRAGASFPWGPWNQMLSRIKGDSPETVTGDLLDPDGYSLEARRLYLAFADSHYAIPWRAISEMSLEEAKIWQPQSAKLEKVSPYALMAAINSYRFVPRESVQAKKPRSGGVEIFWALFKIALFFPLWPFLRYALPFGYPTMNIYMRKMGTQSYSDYFSAVMGDIDRFISRGDFWVCFSVWAFCFGAQGVFRYYQARKIKS